ncbi:MAG TPA: hypothetical protein VFQ53_15575 [Kofleriaceae bacterium]|nr:hypothetical protein [Kofleriaceae bacterium]
MSKWAIAILLLVACGGGSGGIMPPGDDARPPGIDAAPDAAPIVADPAMTKLLYLAIDGVAIVKSTTENAKLNQSTAASQDGVLLPFLNNDLQRQQKLDALTAQLAATLAPYDITITTSRPPSGGGDYHMIVLTDSPPTTLGFPNGVSAVVPTACNTLPSVIGFGFLANMFDTNRLASSTIALFGITGGVPTSTKDGDCMCLSCATLTAPCTLGGAGTPIDPLCGRSGTLDIAGMFLAVYGPRP